MKLELFIKNMKMKMILKYLEISLLKIIKINVNLFIKKKNMNWKNILKLKKMN